MGGGVSPQWRWWALDFKTLQIWLLLCKHRSMFLTTQTLLGRMERPRKPLR